MNYISGNIVSKELKNFRSIANSESGIVDLGESIAHSCGLKTV